MRAFAAPVFLAFLAACTGEAAGTRIYSVVKPGGSGDTERTLRSAPKIAVLGTPPGGASPAAVAAAIVLPVELGGGRPELVAATADTGRIVIAFGRATANELCSGTAGGGSPPTLLVSGAFCNGTAAASYGVVENRGVASVADPAFTATMRVFLGEILVRRQTGGAPR
jgi:hypothetical protein